MQLEGHPAIVRLCRFYQHIRGALPTSISASRPAARLPSGFSPCGFSPCGFSPCGFSPWGFSPCGCNTSRNHGGGSSVASHCAARRLLRGVGGSSVASHCAARRLLRVTTERRSGSSAASHCVDLFSPCGSSVASHCAARRLLRVVTTERRSGLSFSPRPQEGYRNTLSHKTRWSLATTNAAL
jgi:hypothetical protein